MTITSFTFRLIQSLALTLTLLSGLSNNALAKGNGSGICPLPPNRNCLAMNAGKKDADVAGLVLKMTGDWQTDSGDKSHPIHKGDSVVNGWSLKPASHDATITVLLLDGTVVKCPGCAACSGPLVVNKTPSVADSWLSTAIGMFVQKPKAWVAPLSRGFFPGLGQSGAQDSVVKLVGGQIDLSPMFPQKPSGTYYINIYRTPDQSTSPLIFGPAPVEFKKDQPIIIKSANITSGLYKVSFTEDHNDPAGDDAWILVADDKNYERNAEVFDKAKARSEILKKDIAPGKVTELLRAYMTVLGEGSNH